MRRTTEEIRKEARKKRKKQLNPNYQSSGSEVETSNPDQEALFIKKMAATSEHTFNPIDANEATPTNSPTDLQTTDLLENLRINGCTILDHQKKLEYIERLKSKANFILTSKETKLEENRWKTLLSKNICIGEAHSDISPKKFLIKNMELFRDSGFDFIFMEHIFTDKRHQEMLDTYFASPTDEPMPKNLETHLRKLNAGHMGDDETEFDSKNYSQKKLEFNFEQIVIAAKNAGIRIITLDNSFLSLDKDIKEGYSRCLLFNAMAKHIIEKTEREFEIEHQKKPKWLALVGRRHLNSYTYPQGTVPGIADVLECQDVLISDIDQKLESRTVIYPEKIQTEIDNVLASISIVRGLEESLTYDPNIQAESKGDHKRKLSVFIQTTEYGSPPPSPQKTEKASPLKRQSQQKTPE